MQNEEKVEEVCVPHPEEIRNIIQSVNSDETDEEQGSKPLNDFNVLAFERLSAETEKLKEEIAGLKDDREQRKIYADKIYSFVLWYMAGVFFILLLVGSPNHFSLSDTVIITLLGTTTANVLGILATVAAYYFYKNKKK